MVTEFRIARPVRGAAGDLGAEVSLPADGDVGARVSGPEHVAADGTGDVDLLDLPTGTPLFARSPGRISGSLLGPTFWYQSAHEFTIAASRAGIIRRRDPLGGGTRMEQHKSEAEVALELMRLVMEQAGSRRLSPTRTLALYHLCKEAVAYAPEGPVTADYLEDNLKKLLQ